jgi:dihydroflavonol-4-reductase
LPVWVAKIGLPIMSLWAKSKKKGPLYTLFSLATLTSGEVFSHQKATERLGYTTRDMKDTICDTLKI